MFKLFLICLFVFAASFASAQDAEVANIQAQTPTQTVNSTSEIQSQPAGQQLRFLVTPSYYSSSRQIDSDSAGYSRDFSESALYLGLDYGLTSFISVGASTSFGEGQTRRSDRNTKYRFSGMGNVSLWTNIKIPAPGSLVFSFEASISPGKQELATSSVSGNRYEGGNTYTPTVTWEGRAEQMIFGFSTAYTIADNRKSVVKNSSGTTVENLENTGGNTLKAGPYLEYKTDDFALGFRQAFMFVEASEEASSIYQTSKSDPASYSASTLYSAIRVQDYWELVPRATYTTLMNRDLNGVKYTYYNVFDLGLTSRVSF